jgi:hypothetical protein
MVWRRPLAGCPEDVLPSVWRVAIRVRQDYHFYH